MARRFVKRQLGEADIPVASFSDLAFLLIIFFILTTTFQKATGFLTEIPSGEKGEAQEKTTTVALHEEKITLNDEGVTMGELRRRLKELRLGEKDGDAKMVLLTATGDVKYQSYFEAMATISAVGGAIVIEREEEKKGVGEKP